jgi:hypothetical protein
MTQSTISRKVFHVRILIQYANSFLQNISTIDRIPANLAKASRLSIVERYLANLEEYTSFLILCRSTSHAEIDAGCKESGAGAPALEWYKLKHRAHMESTRTQIKIKHQQRLCRIYLQQFETLVQMVSWWWK